MESTDGSGDFSAALARLKRRGCLLLVAGTVPAEAYHRLSGWLLGDPGSPRPRRRVVAVPDDAEASALDRLRESGPTSPSTTGLVVCNGHSRGVGHAVTHGTTVVDGAAGPSVPDPDPDPDPGPGPTPDPGNETPPPVGPADGTSVPVSRVRTRVGPVGAAVDARLARLADDAVPGQLRLAFDPLPALLDREGLASVFGLCHALGARLRGWGGLGHLRLPRPHDDRTVRTLAPLFDGVIRLQLDGDRLRHRWRLRGGGGSGDEDVESGWLSLE